MFNINVIEIVTRNEDFLLQSIFTFQSAPSWCMIKSEMSALKSRLFLDLRALYNR